MVEKIRVSTNQGNGKPIRLLTAPQVAQALGFTVDWVYRKAKAGDLPSVKIGSSVRFREDKIIEYLDQHTQTKEAK